MKKLIIALIMLLALPLAFALDMTDYWNALKFENNYDDSTVPAWNITNNGTSFNASGRSGVSVYCDGAGAVMDANNLNSHIDTATGYVSMWLKPVTSSGQILCAAKAGYSERFLLRFAANSGIEAGVGGYADPVMTAQVIPSDAWSHVIWSWNNTYNYLWINGVWQNETFMNTDNPPDASLWTTGLQFCDFDNLGLYYHGLIDEVYFSNTSLTVAIASELYSSYYPFSAASDISVVNGSVNFTSDGGQSCGFNGTAYITCGASTDRTPTLKFDTGGNSDCKISLTAVNYSNAVDASSWNCSTTGSTSHVCTIGSDMPHDINTVYATCVSGNYEMNSFNDANIINISVIPITTLSLVTDAHYELLTEDGVNYGRSSEGWLSTGEEKNKYISIGAVDDNNDYYLGVAATRLSAILRFAVNGQQVGIIPSNAAGTGQWDFYVFKVNASNIIANNTINITSDSTNADVTYIDFIGLFHDGVIDDGVVPGKSPVIAWINSTNSTVISAVNISGFYTNDSLHNNSYENQAKNAFDITSYLYDDAAYYVMPYADDNITIVVSLNYTYDSTFRNIGNDTVQVDSSDPVFHTITTEVNAHTQYSVNFIINASDINALNLSAYVNDSSFINISSISPNLSIDDFKIFNFSVTYTKPYTKNITLTAEDSAGHSAIYYLPVEASNVSNSSTVRDLNQTYHYNDALNATDVSAAHDLIFISNISINSEGTAYIDNHNQSYYIIDANPNNISVQYGDDTFNSTMFDSNSRHLTWITDAWNNSITNPLTFLNKIRYTVDSAVTLEWENSGVNNIRLFYILPSADFNNSAAPIQIWIGIPLRTTYSSNSSIDLFECTSGIDWGAKTCGGYTEITSEFYAQSDYTYHDSNWLHFPTIDTNSDSKKDYMVIKINVSAEKMYKIDLDAINAEPSWTDPDASNVTSNTTTSSSSGGGGGGSAAVSKTPIPSSISPEGQVAAGNGFLEWIGAFLSMIGDAINGIFNGIGSITSGLDEKAIFYIATAVIGLMFVAMFLGKGKTSGRGLEI